MMKLKWKQVTLLALSALLAVSLAACGSKKQAGGTKEGLTDLTVLLDWYPNAIHSFLYAAQEEGYFKEAGLNVHFKVPAGTDDALKLVAAGSADLAMSYETEVAIARSEQVPVVSVAAIVRHPLNQLFVRADSGVQSPKDLVGKTIGFPSIPIDQELVNTMVKADGGDPAKLKYTDVGYDLIPALSTKKVDAIIGGYINHEKLLLEKEGTKLTVFDPAKYGVPDYYESVLVTSEKSLKDKDKAIRAFWEAARKGQEYTVKNKDKSLQNLLSNQDKDFALDPEVEKQSLDILLPLMDAGKEKFGAQSEANWQAVIDWLKQHGQIKGDVKAKDAFRNL